MPYKDPEKKREHARTYNKQKREQQKAASNAPRRPFCYVTKEGRTVREDVLDQYAVKSEEGSRQMAADRFADHYGPENVIKPLYNPEAMAGILEINTFHARCTAVKARDAAGLGWELEPVVEDPSPTQKEQLKEFFDQQGLTATFYRHQYDIEAVGYGALEVVRADHSADGLPIKFYHIPSHTLRMHSGGEKVVQRRAGKKRYFKLYGVEKDIDYKTGVEHELGSLPADRRATEVLWNSLYSQRSDFYGIPDIVPALGAVHGDLARRDYNLNFFDNFGVPAYAVFITGDYDPGPVDPDTGKTELEEEIENHLRKLADEPHSTLILTVPTREGANNDVKIEFQPLAVETKDASFRLYRKDNRDEIVVAHGVPPYRIGLAETGSLGGSTAAESTQIYKDSVIKPRQEILEEMVNMVVREGFEITDWRFKFAEIDTEDEQHDVQMVMHLFSMGAMRIRDVIQRYADKYGLEDDPDDPLLDTRFVGGQPLTQERIEPRQAQQMQAAMQSLQDKLLKVAIKDGHSYGLENGVDLGDRNAPGSAKGGTDGMDGVG